MPKSRFYFQLAVRLLSLGFNYGLSRWRLRKATAVHGLVFTKGRPVVVNQGTLRISAMVRIWSDVHRTRLAVDKGALLSIGQNCWLNGTTIAASKEIRIGNNCRLEPFSHIMDSDYHDLNQRELPGEMAPVILEDDVCIGTRSTVLRGVTIGQGAVVASAAVVTKNVPAYTMVEGVPAKVVRQLAPPIDK